MSNPNAALPHREVTDYSAAFVLPSSDNESAKKEITKETDGHRLCQRLKQLDYGRNTLGYERYIETVPKHKRGRHNPSHPMTPDVQQICSKRSWDGQVKKWRRELHAWDPEAGEEEERVDLDAVKRGLHHTRAPRERRPSDKTRNPDGLTRVTTDGEEKTSTPDKSEERVTPGQKRKEREEAKPTADRVTAEDNTDVKKPRQEAETSKTKKEGGAPTKEAASDAIYEDFDSIWNLDD
mmetsp:Transcript_33499/g.56264  ORF Transcript_33499/g.56264 Transcript_33499/m.56264 type:complete len:237 (+) Transcript_33499:363-1073(+)|eukprot:CAMPEP_0198203766 /NCGR_PEP_ID=MMETSP1445-20131203/7094_1 /TAXON_ID=36898 /ORGANISM="Pyramimonas sp., Strain CCMP2087" /LENGTH=236 /DNA_ID=CAMNT_0043875293 /DNA_START=363 /DNA_END=1073 /DNA_ORIENTATION=-